MREKGEMKNVKKLNLKNMERKRWIGRRIYTYTVREREREDVRKLQKKSDNFSIREINVCREEDRNKDEKRKRKGKRETNRERERERERGKRKRLKGRGKRREREGNGERERD